MRMYRRGGQETAKLDGGGLAGDSLSIGKGGNNEGLGGEVSGGEKSNERIEVLRGGAKEEEPLEGGELGKEEALAVLNHERGGPKFLKGRRGEEETEGREVVASS